MSDWRVVRCITHGWCSCTVLRYLPSGEEIPAYRSERRRRRKMRRTEESFAARQRWLTRLREDVEGDAPLFNMAGDA